MVGDVRQVLVMTSAETNAEKRPTTGVGIESLHPLALCMHISSILSSTML